MAYIKRSLENLLKRATKEFPVVILTGPRQSGKTTILRHLFGRQYEYLSLEPPDVRAAALADPRGFLELYPQPMIFDEVQYAPELLFYIKEQVDANRSTYGQYILTGSQNLLLSQQVNETLAGRAAILKLLPLSSREIAGSPLAPFPWERMVREVSPLNLRAFWRQMVRGGYPELTEHPKKDPFLWHSSYIHTYLERDVRTLRQIGDLTQFQLFVRALAARSAQLFQLSEVAKEIGVAVNTIKAWVGILEASYQIFILRPYFTNIQKRLVKTPKIYFTDVGTLCYLTGLKDPEHAAAGPLAGALMETAVFSEILKRSLSRGYDPNLYFWRTSSGSEVDLILEQGGKLIPIEIKSTSTPKPAMARGIVEFQRDLGDKVGNGFVVHLGKEKLPLASNVLAIPFSSL